MNLRILLILLLATCNGCALLGNDPYVPEVKPVEVVTITKPAAGYHPPLPKKVTTKDLSEMQHSVDKKKLRGKSGPPGPSISPGSSTKQAPK